MAGFTQEAAAERAGLTRVAYRSIEDGASRPRGGTLTALARALDVSIAALLRPGVPLPRARFRSLKRMNGRSELLLTVVRELDDYVGLEELLNDQPASFLDRIAVGRLRGPTRPIRAAAMVRESLGLKPSEVVANIAGLLEERAGIKVIRLPVSTDAFFGLSIAADGVGPAIIVNTWDRISVERWIFSAAHELGHLVLHAGDFDSNESTEDEDSEREANLFAGHFLMPQHAFASQWADSAGLDLFERVLKIKRVFGVSYKTVLYRLQDAGVKNVWLLFQIAAKRRLGHGLDKSSEPEALSKDAFGYGNPEPRKSLEPGGLNPVDFIPDRRARLVRKAIETGEISVGRGAEILGLPLREMKEMTAAWF